MHQRHDRRQIGGLQTVYKAISDYGIIGNLHGVALLGKDRSIDGCCLPQIDSASLFGALLDARQGGAFRICVRREDGPGAGHLCPRVRAHLRLRPPAAGDRTHRRRSRALKKFEPFAALPRITIGMYLG